MFNLINSCLNSSNHIVEPQQKKVPEALDNRLDKLVQEIIQKRRNSSPTESLESEDPLSLDMDLVQQNNFFEWSLKSLDPISTVHFADDKVDWQRDTPYRKIQKEAEKKKAERSADFEKKNPENHFRANRFRRLSPDRVRRGEPVPKLISKPWK